MLKQARIAFYDSFPVLCTYAPLGVVWGILWEQAGLSPLWGVLYSVFIFGGSVQLLALSLLISQASLLGIILAIVPVALRNSFYTISSLDLIDHKKGIRRYYQAFSLVDATFAILSSKPKELTHQFSYSIPLAIMIHLYWVVGSIIGASIGEHLRDGITSLDFALPALFITLVYDQLKKIKEIKPLFMAVATFVVMWLLFGHAWLLPSLIACIGIVILVPEKKKRLKV